VSELELRLADLGEALAFPPTPAFELRLEPRPARRPLRPLVVALAVAFVLAAGTLALSPGARSAFLELFRLKGATVTRVEQLPEVELIERAELLGVRVGLDAATRQAGFELVDLGEPDEVYLRGDGLVTFVYGSIEQPRLLLSQVRGSVWDGFVKKVGGLGASIEEVDVGGERGLFVSGDPHFVMYRGANGAIQDDRAYLAGTTLLWNRGDVLLRLEADVDRETALELARSVR
jgi:hypothetical protein